MEVGPGVFVSRIGTDDWTTDPEVGGELHVLAAVEGAFVGMSRFDGVSDPEPWLVPVRETIVVLEGAARIEIADGPTLELAVGDMASIPAGSLTTWRLSQPYREIWFFARPYEGGAPE